MALASAAGMWLEAIVTRSDVAGLAAQFSPLEIRLGSDGRLSLSQPSDVTFVPDVGIQIVCDAQLHWPFLGMKVPLTLRGMTFVVRPSVEQRAEGYTLVFRLALEHAGVSNLDFFDEKVTTLVNGELEKHRVELAWTFSRTLTHTFSLPESLLSVGSIGLEVQSGVTKVTSDALGLAVPMGTSVTRRATPSRDPV